LFNKLLLCGHLEGDVIAGIAEIARLRFDFASSAHLLLNYGRYDPLWKRGQGHVLEFRSHCLSGDAEAALEAIAVACSYNPQFVESVPAYEGTLVRHFGSLPYADALLDSSEIDDISNVISSARALIAHERPLEAESLLLRYSPTNAEILKHCLTLSSAYSYQGKLEEAKALIVKLLPRYPVNLVYREGLRLAILLNDYDWGRSLLDDATARSVQIGEMYFRKVAFGNGNIQEAYISFRQMVRLEALKSYLPGRYVQSLDLVSERPEATIVIVAFFGPGDEIRFASMYQEMRDRCAGRRVIFTCDPRLQGLLQRHYVDFEFVPVSRIRTLTASTNLCLYRELPGSDLHPFFDNKGWLLAKSADSVILVTDALGDVIEGYESFNGDPYLKADPYLVEKWTTRLSGNSGSKRLLVGLSWRSSLATYSRNEHYFSVEDLIPLLEVPNVQFVNLQYDECSEELAWIDKRFKGRVLHFDDLDQYNDLDGVGALMSCLDLVIAPGTTVFELAGALGVRTWLLSNSSEFHWRKVPGTDIDAWHRSLNHIESAQLGNKQQVIAAARDRLLNFYSRSAKDDRAAA
jgi:capsular polysaccharide export protein